LLNGSRALHTTNPYMTLEGLHWQVTYLLAQDEIRKQNVELVLLLCGMVKFLKALSDAATEETAIDEKIRKQKRVVNLYHMLIRTLRDIVDPKDLKVASLADDGS
jgi:hypothetical protein